MWGSARGRATVVAAIAVAVGTASLAGPVTSAVAARSVRTAVAEVDPDDPGLICQNASQQPLGFQGFEGFTDGQTLTSASVPGLDLTGWSAGDFSTGRYSGKFPAGDFSSQQTHFATAASSTPVIKFVQPASTVSLLVDVPTGSTVAVHARDAANHVIGTSTHKKSGDGRHMVQFQLNSAIKNISSVVLDVPTTTQDFFTLDAVCTDDSTMMPGQITLKYADGPPGTKSFIHGFGFQPGERTTVAVQGNPVTTSPKADANGHFDLAFTMPITAPPGSNPIVATGNTSHITAIANFFVHTDWNQYGFDAQKTGNNLHENELSLASVSAGLHTAWTASVGGSQASSATTAKGVVYVNSTSGSVYAFEENSPLATPPTIGQVATGGPIFPTPTIDVDRVFVAGSDGHIYAFDPQLGLDPEWSYPKQTQTSKFVFNRSPAVLNLVMYITDSRNGNVFAMNEDTGKPNWTFPLHTKVHSALAVDDKHVYVGDDNGNVYAITLDGTKIDWQAKAGTARLGDVVLSSTKAATGKLFIGSADGHVYAFNTADGSPAWTKPVSVAYPEDQALAVANGVLYVGLSDPAGTLQARSMLTGKLAWHVTTGGAITSKPTIANGVIYVTTANGELVALNPNGSGIVQHVSLGSTTTPSAPVVDNGAIYVGTGDGRVLKFVP